MQCRHLNYNPTAPVCSYSKDKKSKGKYADCGTMANGDLKWQNDTEKREQKATETSRHTDDQKIAAASLLHKRLSDGVIFQRAT
jgi:hypothetical protein